MVVVSGCRSGWMAEVDRNSYFIQPINNLMG